MLRNMAGPMFGARLVAHLSGRMWVHSSFSEGRVPLDSRPFISMLVKDNGFQRFLSFLLPSMLLGSLSCSHRTAFPARRPIKEMLLCF